MANTKIAELSAEAITTKEESPLTVVWRRFRKHKMAMISLVLITVIFLISLFAEQISPFAVDELDVSKYFAPWGDVDKETGRVHYMGTDNIGRDYFSRLVAAGRISLSVALFSVFISVSIGITVGAIAGYYGGITDTILMRFVELLLTIPDLPLLLILSSMLIQNQDAIPIPEPVLFVAGKIMLLSPFQARQAVLIILVLAGLGWLGVAQIMRGMILSLREQTFVEASRSLGASDVHIIFRHMIPNAMAPIIVSASLGMAGYVVAEAALSFLGFGIQDPIPTWGNMLSATQQFMLDKPWLPLVPGLPIFICALAFNYIGDGLRDALDPRLKM
ncbi:MAG: ABC transporter permease [Anaerolineales bacterium]